MLIAVKLRALTW
jgi:transposase-like protein